MLGNCAGDVCPGWRALPVSICRKYCFFNLTKTCLRARRGPRSFGSGGLCCIFNATIPQVTPATAELWLLQFYRQGGWGIKRAVSCLMLFDSKRETEVFVKDAGALLTASTGIRIEVSIITFAAVWCSSNKVNIWNTRVLSILQALCPHKCVHLHTQRSPKALLRKGSTQPSFLSFKCIKMEAQRS